MHNIIKPESRRYCGAIGEGEVVGVLAALDRARKGRARIRRQSSAPPCLHSLSGRGRAARCAGTHGHTWASRKAAAASGSAAAAARARRASAALRPLQQRRAGRRRPLGAPAMPSRRGSAAAAKSGGHAVHALAPGTLQTRQAAELCLIRGRALRCTSRQRGVPGGLATSETGARRRPPWRREVAGPDCPTLVAGLP